MRRAIGWCLLGSTLFAGTAQGGLLEYGFSNIQVPGSSTTFAQGINNDGVIVGTYWGDVRYSHGVLVTHGFIRSADGTYARIDIPGAIQTSPTGINDAGEIAVYYIDGHGNGHSALLSAGGQTLLDVPGQVFTLASDVNNQGDTVGYYSTGDSHAGFIRSGDGSITSIQLSADVTEVTGIDDRGRIVGYYLGPWTSTGAAYHGFARESDGTVTVIDVPGAANTNITGINNGGMIAGTYNIVGDVSGFVRTPDGVFTTVDVPGASFGSFVEGINNAGDLVGYYHTPDGQAHGFLATILAPGTPPPPFTPGALTPEPSSILTFLLGIVGLGLVRSSQQR